jgi:transcriptional regulator with XRE-family HTH domain
MRLAEQFGRTCRRVRIELDLTQQAVADALGVSRTFIARVELARTPVDLGVVERIGQVLGIRAELTLIPPRFLTERRSHDRVHAWCVTYVARRLVAAGWQVAREVDVSDGSIHGWIDLLAFDPRSGTLVVLEVKTLLADLGALQRQVSWYERRALTAARSLGWRPRRFGTWVLCLASAEVEAVLRTHGDVFERELPSRAPAMLAAVAGEAWGGRGLALIDPSSRRRAWLIRTRLDGRRSPAPFADYADAARRLGR